MSISYGWEVLYTTTRGLATGEGRIQERLGAVFTNYLAARISNLKRDGQITDEMQEKLDDVRRRMTVVPAAGRESSYDATTRSMSDEEARKIAEILFDLFDEVARMNAVDEYRREQKQKKRAAR